MLVWYIKWDVNYILNISDIMVAGCCSFMDKMYSMSSPESLVKFVRSPRTYLVPPHPMLPCKVCVLGLPLSGKTTLANLIAEKYDAIVSSY